MIFGVFHFSYAALDLSKAPDFCKYLRNLFTTLLSLAAFLAVLMIVIAGSQWIAAAGNPSTITDSKDMIWKAIVGLILAFASWMILESINPDLVGFSGCQGVSIGSYVGIYGGSLQTQGFTEAQQRQLEREKEQITKSKIQEGFEGMIGAGITGEEIYDVASGLLKIGRKAVEYNPQETPLTDDQKKEIEEALNGIDYFNDRQEPVPDRLREASENMIASLYENRSKLSPDLRQRVEETFHDFQIYNQTQSVNLGG